MRQSIREEVMKLASRLAQRCHPSTAEHFAGLLAGYSGIATACDAFDSFNGCRPADDEDIYATLAQRRSKIADVLACANLDGSACKGQEIPKITSRFL